MDVVSSILLVCATLQPAAGPDLPAPVATVDLSVQDAPLREVLQSLAKTGGVTLVIDPEVEGTVTAELSDVPWPDALRAILKANGLAAETVGGRATAK